MNSVDPYQNSILVCALQLDGRGDIYGAHEILLRIKKLMPHDKVIFTVLKPRLSPFEIAYHKIVFEDITEIQKQEHWEIEPENDVLKIIDTFKRIIVFPTYDDSMLPLEILKRNEDVIKLREYGVGEPLKGNVHGSTYTLGLAKHKGEKGVLLPMEFSEKLPPHKEETPLQRLSHLEQLHPILSKSILGEEFSLDAAIKFNQTSKLYFGYFSQSVIFFCYINALLRCNEGNVVICTSKKRPEGLLSSIKETLLNEGFIKLNIIEFMDGENSKSQSLDLMGSHQEKTCTLIFRGLSGIEMDALLDATEDESLTTGDNSPLRFMAHRKTFTYDTRRQKREYARTMIDLAAQFDHRFKTLMENAFHITSNPQVDEETQVNIQNGMIALFKAMKDPTLKENWYRFIEEIFAKYDFGPELEKILQERM